MRPARHSCRRNGAWLPLLPEAQARNPTALYRRLGREAVWDSRRAPQKAVLAFLFGVSAVCPIKTFNQAVMLVLKGFSGMIGRNLRREKTWGMRRFRTFGVITNLCVELGYAYAGQDGNIGRLLICALICATTLLPTWTGWIGTPNRASRGLFAEKKR